MMSECKVYAAVGKVMATLARNGISKDRNNAQQGYKFRGIDDVYNAIAPALVDAKLIVIPAVLSRTCEERTSAKGSALFYVTVAAEFLMVSTEDGSSVKAGPFYGEAMDSGDKATNKAMSAAYKYWAMQTFAIPTEGDNDADSTTHNDIQPKQLTGKEQTALQTLRAASLEGTAALQKAWQEAGKELRARLADELPSLKDAAAKVVTRETVNA